MIESALAEEITAYHLFQSESCDWDLDAMMDNTNDEPFLNSIKFRNVGSAHKPALYRNEIDTITGPMVPYGYVHVFTELSQVSPADGPRTPFLAFLNIDNSEVPSYAPRVMWPSL